MSDHKLMISSAGSGKTTFLVSTALNKPKQRILITTYTENNEREIRKKFIDEIGYVPKNVTIQTWFSFLIQHGVKPFQGSVHPGLFKTDISGLLLSNQRSGRKYDIHGNPISSKLGHPLYWPEENNRHFYFSRSMKIYSDKVSKFVIRSNEMSEGSTIQRLEKIYDAIFIDEVQDLAGYDLELIKILLKTNLSILMVGDPRQVTYLTHHEAKHGKYKDGKLKEFLEEKCKKYIKDGIDEKTLSDSHRCSVEICEYATLLYPDLPPTTSCGCCNVVPNEHQGVFLINAKHVDDYLKKYDPIQLRWDRREVVNEDYSCMNMGESKGTTFERVLIYPTDKMIGWIEDNTKNIAPATRAKLYVAITRAKYSVAIVYDYDTDTNYPGMIKYAPA